MGAEPAIRTEGLTKRYGDFTAVDHLDLEVQRGEIFGLLGPNGAGKTTTILMLLGLSDPTEGVAEVVGLDPTRHPLDVKRQVGYLPDNVGFYGTLTGRQNLRYTASLNGLEAQEAERRIDTLLQQAGLSAASDDRVDTYSRGMRQRLGIADALVKDPQVMILDEPTVAIDPEGVAEVLTLIRSLASDRGVTMLLSSHLLHQVQSVCDRVGLFVAGRMVAQGPMNELADRLVTGPVTVEVGVDADGHDVEAMLLAVQGVERVERDPQNARLWLVTGSSEVQDQLARSFLSVALPVWHLRRRGGELDDIYRHYFEQGVGRGGAG